MTSKSGINKSAVNRLKRDLQREFNRKPLRIPIEPEHRPGRPVPPPVVNNNYSGPVYHGPVVTNYGDHAQIAWDGGTNVSNQNSQTVTAGYEELAQTVAGLLERAGELGLDEPAEAELREAGEEVLAEVVKDEPDKGVVARGIRLLKGTLAAVGAGIDSAVTDESKALAVGAIEQLSNLPF